jgi:hypothetical protein
MRHLFRVGGIVLSLLILAPAAQAADRDAIKQAIERGVAALKGMQQSDGTWLCREIGGTALAGLTLLECDAPTNDLAVKAAADAVRAVSVGETRTYSLALSILFLDRLGEEADVPLIESMAVRLLAGQGPHGGWSYQVPDVSENESRRLASLLKQRNELSTRPRPSETRSPADRAAEQARVEAQRKLTKEIRQQIEVINKPGFVRPILGREDNSNSQFAVLALWVARRHGLPTDESLKLVNKRFRDSQNGDGGWDYLTHSSRNGRSTPTMTCAGLLGLAVGFGLAEATLRTDKPKEGDKAAKAVDPTRDKAVRAGLAALGSSLGNPVGPNNAGAAPRLTQGGRFYYFLWSLERVAVAFGLNTIGGKDWYGWGSEIALANQQADGTWRGDFSLIGADTCFALLFLRRANLARDLTSALKGKFEDPGAVTLQSGGINGEALKQRIGLDSALKSPDMFGGTKSEGDTGPSTKPAAKSAEPDAGALSKQLIQAPPPRQAELIEKMRDTRGAVQTEALASAIPQLDGETRKKAREALAERMSRMTTETLGLKLGDENAEVRRAAALAVAMKEDRTHVERLIGLLEDKEATVSRAAYAALKSLSGEDFGPANGADPDDQKKAVAAWRTWWKEKGKR